jgi:hypothetical protein
MSSDSCQTSLSKMRFKTLKAVVAVWCARACEAMLREPWMDDPVERPTTPARGAPHPNPDRQRRCRLDETLHDGIVIVDDNGAVTLASEDTSIEQWLSCMDLGDGARDDLQRASEVPAQTLPDVAARKPSSMQVPSR